MTAASSGQILPREPQHQAVDVLAPLDASVQRRKPLGDVINEYHRAGHQHELPAHVTVLADAVRRRDLGERKGLRDREREAPGLDQLVDPGDRVDRAASVPAAGSQA